MTTLINTTQEVLSETNQNTSLKSLVDAFKNETERVSSVFHNLVVTDLSFVNKIDNIKYYPNYSTADYFCYLLLSDSSGYVINAICSKKVFEYAKQKYELNNKKSIDIRIDSLKMNKKGSLVLKIKSIRENGVSALEVEKRKIIKHCKDSFYFKAYKKPLPNFIYKIALITTNTGNTASDIIEQIGIKKEYLKLVKCDSNAHAIAKAIKEVTKLNEYRLVCLFRGGNEDTAMLNFSKIEVIDAVAGTVAPIATAIGHESDKPIVQDVADLSYDTPSSFARAMYYRNRETFARVDSALYNIRNGFKEVMNNYRAEQLHKKINTNIDLLINRKKSENMKKVAITLGVFVVVLGVSIFVMLSKM